MGSVASQAEEDACKPIRKRSDSQPRLKMPRLRPGFAELLRFPKNASETFNQ